MNVSVFTPSHHHTYLPDLYASLRAQSDPDWQWTILHNNGARPLGLKDPRVKECVAENTPPFVGALKAEAVRRASGDVLLEVDHDDLLAPNAVAEVKRALAGEAGFCYSNTIETDANLAPRPQYSEKFGWRYRPTRYAGHDVEEMVAFAPTPESISRIWYAPNHLRAFKRDAYLAAGGYNEGMRVLDDQDLMCRLYGVTPFVHIDAPLYVQRIHGENTQLKHNAEIQENVMRLHDKYIADLAMAWTKRAGLRCLDLGARFNSPGGYETVDAKGADVCCDLDGDWPFANSSVGLIRAFDVFEHLRDPIHTMREAFRVLAPGGWILAQVPSTDGRGAWQDPTHRSFWNENSWLYYTNRNWAKYIDAPVRFQAVRCYTTEKDVRQVCWTVAHLVSLKDGHRPPGLIDI